MPKPFLSLPKIVPLLTILIGIHSLANGQGSGKAINFGAGTNAQNFTVELPATFPKLGAVAVNGSKSFTITAWFYTTNNTNTAQRIFEDDQLKTRGYALSVGDPGTGAIRFYSRGTSLGANLLKANTATNVIASNKWYYVAAVIIPGTSFTIYVNGIQQATVTDSRAGTFGNDGSQADFGGEAPTSSEKGLGYFIHGYEDEVIIWNQALTQAQLQAAMCQKQTLPNANIIAYWNLDGATTGANGVPDITGNGYNGTMSAAMTNGDVVTSGASLGDVSTQLYSPATWAGKTLTLPAAVNGTTFTVTTVLPATGGSAPAGVQLYQLNAVPGITTGITGLGNNNVYYGVYVVNGTGPTYNATINYTAYDVTTKAEMFYRNNNAASPWTAGNTNPVPPPYTITQASSTIPQEEYILGTTSSALPVNLLSFSAVCDNYKALLQWATATEVNNDYFTVERTEDGYNYEVIGTVKGSGNSDFTHYYSFIDQDPPPGILYYRLTQTDLDGTTSPPLQTIVYEPCGDETIINAYSTTDKGIVVQINSKTSENYKVSVYDATGRTLASANYQVVIGSNIYNLRPNISAGIYIIRIMGTNTVYTKKLFVQN